MSGLNVRWRKAATLVGLVCGLELVALAAIAGVGFGASLGVQTPVIVCVVASAVVGIVGYWWLVARPKRASANIIELGNDSLKANQ